MTEEKNSSSRKPAFMTSKAAAINDNGVTIRHVHHRTSTEAKGHMEALHVSCDDSRLIVHARPVHVTATPSPFSKESREQNYRGFLHLAILLLVVNMVRLVLENFKKYGFLISIPGRHLPLSDLLYVLLTLTALWISLLGAYGVEVAALRFPRRVCGARLAAPAILNVTLLLCVPAWIVWTRLYHPVVGSLALMASLVLCMKIISYHLVNAELRRLYLAKSPLQAYPASPYPQNITLVNFLYFWCVPTLCYQPVYPQIARFRRSFFLKRIVELTACLAMMYILVEQYTMPTVQNSMKLINDLDGLGMLERLLKLSLSSLFIWLLGFYALFHSFLNAFAEVLRFGDRTFYRAWWNANSIEEYWRLWNAPVHDWLKRHVYVPLRARRVSADTARMIIFALSAIVHEYLIAVPTNVVQGWALLAMLAQIPLISLTNLYMHRYPQTSVGNYFFWICFCILGQPMCILLYYRAWISQGQVGPPLFSPPNAIMTMLIGSCLAAMFRLKDQSQFKWMPARLIHRLGRGEGKIERGMAEGETKEREASAVGECTFEMNGMMVDQVKGVKGEEEEQEEQEESFMEQTVNDVDYIIELSILKIRRMQIMGQREERQRLLVAETLQEAIACKVQQLQQSGHLGMDSVCAFVTILHESIRRLGLTRIVRIGLEPPKGGGGLPRLRLPSVRRTRISPILSHAVVD